MEGGGIQFDVLFSTLGLAFVLLMAMRAWRKGALSSIKRLFSWVAAIGAAVFMFKHGVGFYESGSGASVPGWLTGVVSCVMAVAAFALARLIGRWAFERTFGEEGPLAAVMKGPSGAVLSLIPSTLVLLLLSLMIRMTGSVYELDQINQMTQMSRVGSVTKLAAKPLFTRWRDGVEIWPKSKWALDQLDPLTSVANRNLAALVVASFVPEINAELRKREQTSWIANHPEVVKLVADEDLKGLISGEAGMSAPKFLLNVKLREALRDEELSRKLSKIDMADEIESILTGKDYPRNKTWLRKIFS